MTITRFICSSKVLAGCLHMAAHGCAQQFKVVPPQKDFPLGRMPDATMWLATQPLGIALWIKGYQSQDFDLPFPQVVRLRNLLDLIEEQPITVSWDGHWITLNDVTL